MRKRVDPFHRLLNEVRELHRRKNHDYAGADDRLANLKLCEMAGIPGWVGVSVRLTDKLSRLLNFVRQGKLAVKDEGIRDTLLDMAVYSLLAIVLLEERVRKDEPRPPMTAVSGDDAGGRGG